MSAHVSDDTAVPAQTASSALTDRAWRGLLISLIPCGLLLVSVAVIVLLTVLARLLMADAGFFAQQQAAVLVLIAGLILAIAGYIVALWRTLRRVRIWQQEGKRTQASAALWGLGATALLVVVPVLLALVFPQHPFP